MMGTEPVDNGSDIRDRILERNEFYRCLCAYTDRCPPSRQDIAGRLGVVPDTCIVAPNYPIHTNPTSRTDCDPGF